MAALLYPTVHKGVVTSVGALPASGNKQGDVYHVATPTIAGYQWQAAAWVSVGSIATFPWYPRPEFAGQTFGIVKALGPLAIS